MSHTRSILLLTVHEKMSHPPVFHSRTPPGSLAVVHKGPPPAIMQHRRVLLCTLTLAFRHAGFAAAVFVRPSQVKRVVPNATPNMYHQLKVRSNIRSLTRAAFAASGTAHLSQQQHGLEPRPSRWISSSSSRGSNFGAGWWRSCQQPAALSMSAAAAAAAESSSSSSRSTRSLASGPLRFRGAATTDGESCRCIRRVCLPALRVVWSNLLLQFCM